MRGTTGSKKSTRRARVISDMVSISPMRGKRLPAYQIGIQGKAGAHQLQLNARHDRIEKVDSASTGYLGYGFNFTNAWKATASISDRNPGQGRRAPVAAECAARQDRKSRLGEHGLSRIWFQFHQCVESDCQHIRSESRARPARTSCS